MVAEIYETSFNLADDKHKGIISTYTLLMLILDLGYILL